MAKTNCEMITIYLIDLQASFDNQHTSVIDKPNLHMNPTVSLEFRFIFTKRYFMAEVLDLYFLCKKRLKRHFMVR